MSPRRSLVFLVALVVVASVAATAHGLYAVAVTSGVPWRVALLYPVITDGLALVAYWATKQLDSARYPWVVIVVAAGLSGLAQAVNLAGLGESPMWLRFGDGYWPAIGALLAAHLLWLVWRPRSVEVAVPYAGGSDPLEPESDPSAPDELYMTAQTVAAHLGDRLSRRTLVAGLRERGHAVSTTRAGELLKQLRDAA